MLDSAVVAGIFTVLISVTVVEDDKEGPESDVMEERTASSATVAKVTVAAVLAKVVVVEDNEEGLESEATEGVSVTVMEKGTASPATVAEGTVALAKVVAVATGIVVTVSGPVVT